VGCLFVIMHEARIASHVGGYYRHQPSSDRDWPLLHHSPQSNPKRTVRRVRDSAKRVLRMPLLDWLAAHLSVLASEVERVMLESGKKR
jgi:hypothetical protein